MRIAKIQIKNLLGIKEKDPVEIFVDGDSIVLKPVTANVPELKDIVAMAIMWSQAHGTDIMFGTKVENNNVHGFTITDKENEDISMRLEDIR